MTETANSESRRRAVLAAVLAVKRGLLTPDDAVSMLDGVLQPTEREAAADPAGTLLAVSPSGDMTRELNALLEQGDAAFAALGMDAGQQQSLLSLKPGSADAKADARRALASMAQTRLETLRSQLPVSSAERYTIQREFARGGMGRILVATDTAVGREVALKEVLPARSSQPGPDPEIMERFVREAKVTGQLEHPNIVPVYEICRRADGSVFYTMKLVRGKSLAATLHEISDAETTDAEKLAARLKLMESFLGVCRAIAYAHSRGVIHRDLKPQNIVLGSFGETMVLDWGLARVSGEAIPLRGDTPAMSQSVRRDGNSSQTQDGSILGTPAYMPPEQALGRIEQVDELSDVYSLGAILYEILAGRPPYEGTSAESILAKVVESKPAPLATVNLGAPPELVHLVERAMARERSKRLRSAEVLANEIAAFRDGRPLSIYEYSSLELMRRFVSRNRATTVVIALATLMLAIVIGWSVSNVASERDAAREALQLADAEQTERLALEERQRKEYAGLLEKQTGRIAGQRKLVAAMNPELEVRQARERQRELEQLSPQQRQSLGVNRVEVGLVTSRLMKLAEAQEVLLRLATEPVAGREARLVPGDELDALRSALMEVRLLATALAALNEDFALAELIVAGTAGPADVLSLAAQSVADARSAQQRHRAGRIAAILEAIRTGKDAGGGHVNDSRVRDFVAEVSAWREPQTVELLAAAASEVVKFMRTQPQGLIRDVRRRLEVQFIAEVFSMLGLPTLTIPPLAELLAATTDHDLMLLLAITLCRQDHALAWRPLVDLRSRIGFETGLWQRIRRYLVRVPEPPAPADEGAEDALMRARVRADQGRYADAESLLQALLNVDPDLEAALYLSALMAQAQRPRLREHGLSRVDRLLALNPRHARGLALKGRLLLAGQRTAEEADKQHARIQALLDQAIEIDPDDWHLYVTRGTIQFDTLHASQGHVRNPEAALRDFSRAIVLNPTSTDAYRGRARILVFLGRTSEALADFNVAVATDPENATQWYARGDYYMNIGDFDAASRDYTQAIEIEPDNIAAYASRAWARRMLGDFMGALADCDIVVKIEGARFPPIFSTRAYIKEAMGDIAGAIADLEHYISLRPDFYDVEEIRAEIDELKKQLPQKD